MQYRSFGHTGEKISALGFGAMRLPMTPGGEHVDEEKAIPVIQRAYELGVNYFDTALYYCENESEIVLVPYEKAYEEGFEDMQRRVPDLSKLRALTGYEPQVTLDEVLDRVVAYFTSDATRL